MDAPAPLPQTCPERSSVISSSSCLCVRLSDIPARQSAQQVHRRLQTRACAAPASHGYVGWRVHGRLTPCGARGARVHSDSDANAHHQLATSERLRGFQDWFKKVRIGFGDLFKLQQQQQQQQPGSATRSFIHAGCERIPRMNK